jgi:hypothetical protein
VAWLKLSRDDSDSKENRARYERAASERLSRITSRTRIAEDEDPADVAARLRNLCHGTSSN